MAYKVQFFIYPCFESGKAIEPLVPEKFDTYEAAVAKIDEYSRS